MPLELGLEDLRLVGADFYGLGHIHLGEGNEWLVDGRAPAVFPGSPRRVHFGELEPKGYVVGEINDARECAWERVPTPATRMLLFKAEWGYSELADRDGWLSGPNEQDLESVRGAEVKLKYRVPASKREAAALAVAEAVAKMKAAGAVDVVPEPEVVVEQRARAPEVSRATTLPDKMLALWKAKGFDPAERREPLLDKLNQLEGTV